MSPHILAGYTIYWRFPSLIERLAEPVRLSEIDRISYQQDNESIWMLTSINPITWVRLSGDTYALSEFSGDPLALYILAKV